MVNFTISGKMILDDMLCKRFSKYVYFGWINFDTPSCFIDYNTFFFTILYCNIALQMHFVLYGEYSIDFYFDPPTQSSLNIL